MWNAQATNSPNYVAIGLCLGVAVGPAIGIALGNIALGIGPGIAIGVALGLMLKKRNAWRSSAAEADSNGDGA